jgi:ribose-phosphate pyrophosphokinase
MTTPHILSPMQDGIVIMASEGIVPQAQKVADRLRALALPIEFKALTIETFSYPETCVDIDMNVRGKTVFLFHGFTRRPNDDFMKMMIICDALRRSSAKSIVLITPFLPYSRQDRLLSREPFSAKLIASLIEVNPIITQLVTLDLHAPQITGFFNNIQVENIPSRALSIPHIRQKYAGRLKETTVVSTDVGGAKAARYVAEVLGLEVAIVDKRRTKEKSEALTLVGEVKKNAILIDDIGDSARSLVDACNIVRRAGAESVEAYLCHALLSPKNGTTAEAKLAAAQLPITFTDTFPREASYYKKHPTAHVIPADAFLADIICALISVNGSVKGTIKSWINKEGIPE